MAKNTTVRDVAAAAGVSTATASRALAGRSTVHPDLVRRVIEASRALGYSANPHARALRTQRTDTVGMVVPSINNPYFIGAVEAVENVLADQGRSLILCDTRDDIETEASRIALLINKLVDGLIVIPVSSTLSAPALMAAARDLAVVQFDRYAEAASTDFVGMDNADGMQQCLSLLRHEGCRTFVYVGAQPQTTTASERLASFLSATTAEERPTGDQFLGDFTMSWGVAAATRLLAGDRLPDAVVCGADVIAVGLMGALRSAGVQIPEQLRLVSFDDSELGRVTVPALASVHQPIDSMATEAVRLLDMRREHRDAPIRKSLFQPELITRGSAVLTA